MSHYYGRMSIPMTEAFVPAHFKALPTESQVGNMEQGMLSHVIPKDWPFSWDSNHPYGSIWVVDCSKTRRNIS